MHNTTTTPTIHIPQPQPPQTSPTPLHINPTNPQINPVIPSHHNKISKTMVHAVRPIIENNIAFNKENKRKRNKNK